MQKASDDRTDYIIVAAIDFGTTYSGYAFSFKSSKEEIKMNKNWGGNVGFQSYKTPTCVLTGPNGEFHAFGYDAETKYGDLIEGQGDPSKWDMYRHFKMTLHSKKVSMSTPISSTNGSLRPAMEIFAMSLRYLKGHLLESLSQQVASAPDENCIRWVITVPAIWDEESKQFMREAALQAGYIKNRNSKRLFIALEPEAASLCCRRLEVSHFLGKSGDVRFQAGAKYLVIDSGGGTVDVTAHQILPSDHVKELHVATGGPWGGTKVDDNFIKLLEKVLGTHFINEYRSSCPQQWLNLMVNFEKLKRAAKPDGQSSMNLAMSWSLGSKYQQVMGKSVEDAVLESHRHGVKFASGALVIEHKAVVNMFKPVVQDIVDHIQSLMQNPKLQTCKYFFLVGGFSESAFIQKAIKNSFQGSVDVLIPEEAQMSVIKGAVLFGHCPEEIKTRIARKTYGYRHLAEFDSSKHKAEKKITRECRDLCEDLFGTFIQKGDEVDIGNKRESNHNPVTASQDGMDIEFYSLDGPTNPVTYIDDFGVQRLGHLHVDMPGHGLERTVKLEITFGGTEIAANATDVNSGMSAETKINFLAA